MTLEQKLRSVMVIDDTGDGPIGQAHARLGLGPFSHRELDLTDWGVYYGIAFGIARDEEPFEAHEDVARRALEAAWPIYLENSGPIARREADGGDR